jgi:hypothetical protein
MKKYLIFTILILTLISPVFSYAQGRDEVKLNYDGLVKCDGVVTEGEQYRQEVCDFNALMGMVKSTINWLFVITVPIVTVLMAYAGLLYMTGTSGNISTAKKIFPSVATGFIIMLIAWVSVITVVNWFISKENEAVVNTFVGSNKQYNDKEL